MASVSGCHITIFNKICWVRFFFMCFISNYRESNSLSLSKFTQYSMPRYCFFPLSYPTHQKDLEIILSIQSRFYILLCSCFFCIFKTLLSFALNVVSWQCLDCARQVHPCTCHQIAYAWNLLDFFVVYGTSMSSNKDLFCNKLCSNY